MRAEGKSCGLRMLKIFKASPIGGDSSANGRKTQPVPYSFSIVASNGDSGSFEFSRRSAKSELLSLVRATVAEKVGGFIHDPARGETRKR